MIPTLNPIQGIKLTGFDEHASPLPGDGSGWWPGAELRLQVVDPLPGPAYGLVLAVSALERGPGLDLGWSYDRKYEPHVAVHLPADPVYGVVGHAPVLALVGPADVDQAQMTTTPVGLGVLVVYGVCVASTLVQPPVLGRRIGVELRTLEQVDALT